MKQATLRSRSGFLLHLAAAALLLAATVPAWAQYPDRPVKVVVPFSAGGSGDAVQRLFAQKLSERTGKPFIIDNKTGAGGRIAYDTVAKSRGDGYTLAGADPGYAVLGALYPKLPWDHAKDLVPVAMYARTPFAIVVSGNSRFKSMRQLVEYARANPGKVTIGTPGVGSVGYFTLETMRREAKVEVTHVPFKGGSEALAAVMSNTIDAFVTAPPTILGHMKTGAVSVLGMTSEQRWPGAEAVPTLVEQGVNFTSYLWFGLLAPSETPQPVLDQLQQQVAAVLKDPRTKDDLRAQAVELTPLPARELARVIQEQTKAWADVVRLEKISIE